MLKAMRDNLKSLSVLLWLVIAAFILSVFVTWGMKGRYTGGMGTNVVATVNKLPVEIDEFRHALNNQRNLYRSLYKDRYQEMIQNLDLEMSVLDSLVNQKVAISEARRLGMDVTPDQVQQEILGMSSFQRDGQFIGQDMYRRLLEMNEMTAPTFEKMVANDILFSRYRELITDAVFVSEGELREAFSESSEKAVISYVTFKDSEFKDRVELTDELLTAYYDEHQDDFQQPEKRTVNYLLVETRRLQDEVELPEEDIEYYYEDNKESEFFAAEQVRASHILLKIDGGMDDEKVQALRTQAEDLARRAREGEDFAALAEEFSEDSSASRGGDLGFFGEGAMVEPFEAAAFSMEIDEISDVVETQFGLHVIKVMEKKEAGYRPMDEVREMIDRRLKMETAQGMVPERAAELLAQLETGTTFDQLSAEEGGSYTLREATFAEEETIPLVGRNPEFAAAAFSIEAPGGFAQPVAVPQGMAIISLVEVIDPHVPPLEEIRSMVEGECRLVRAQELARESAQQIWEKTESSGPQMLEEIAGSQGFEFKTSEPFARNGYIEDLGNTRVIDGAVFTLADGELGPVTPITGGHVIFVLRQREAPSEEDYQLEKENLRTQLISSQQQLLFASAIEELREHQTVSINPAYFGGDQQTQ